ncbi:MAG: nucleotidyltransferase domain-containing protein [Candidatus Diapherotrites archaeon]
MLGRLSSLTNRLAGIPEIYAIILYGSYAKKAQGKKSDIDLLIIAEKSNEKLKKKINEIIENQKIGRKVVQTVITEKELSKSPYYLFDVLRDGIVLYKNPKALIKLPLALKEQAVTVYSFTLSKMSHKNRARINRELYGEKSRKKIGKKYKLYKYLGVIEKVKGIKLGKGSILTPSKAEKEIEKLFKKYKLKYEKIHLIEIEKERVE